MLNVSPQIQTCIPGVRGPKGLCGESFRKCQLSILRGWCAAAESLRHVRLFVTPWTAAPRFLCPWDSLGKHTGVGCHALLQGIFPTKGSNLGLLHCRQIFLSLSHQGNPVDVLPQVGVEHVRVGPEARGETGQHRGRTVVSYSTLWPESWVASVKGMEPRTWPDGDLMEFAIPRGHSTGKLDWRATTLASRLQLSPFYCIVKPGFPVLILGFWLWAIFSNYPTGLSLTVGSSCPLEGFSGMHLEGFSDHLYHLLLVSQISCL